MIPLEAMYANQNYHTLVNFVDPQNRVEVSRQMLERMDEEVKLIRKNIPRAQDRQKHYDKKKHSFCEFHIGKIVFLKVIPKRGSNICNELSSSSIRSMRQTR